MREFPKANTFYALAAGLAFCLFLLFLGVFGQATLKPKEEASPSLSKPSASPEDLTLINQDLPEANQLLSSSRPYSRQVLRGIKINPEDPLRLEFIIDTQDKEEITKEELETLVKYFLAALTIPEEELWVNLSPYEPERIIPESLGLTALGKDLLS